MSVFRVSRLLFCFFITAVFITPSLAVEPEWRVKSDQNADILLSDDGTRIVVGGEHITVLTGNGQEIWKGWSGSTNDLSGDGKYLLNFQGFTERLIDNAVGAFLWEKGRPRFIVDAVISSNGAMIVSAEEDGVVRFCNNAGIGLGTNLDNEEMPEKIRQLAVSGDGEQTIAVAESGLYSYNRTGNLTWWNERGGEKVALSDDNTVLATIRGNTVSVFHAGGSEKWHNNLFHGECLSFAFSGDGSTVVIGSNDNNVYVIDGTGEPLWTFDTRMWAYRVAVSSDGSKIASGSMNKDIYLFDRQGNVIWNYRVDGAVKSVALTKDGTFLVVSTDTSIYGFDTTEEPQETPPHTTVLPPTTVVQTTSPVQTTGTSAAGTPTPTQAPVSGIILVSGILLAVFLMKRE
jgi:WD40 repeat protein